MKIIKHEPVTRTYCDECGDECMGTVVHLNDNDYCEKQSCRGEWDKHILKSRVISDIKGQLYFS